VSQKPTREPNWYIVSYRLGWDGGTELDIDVKFQAWTAEDAKTQGIHELRLQAPHLKWNGINRIAITNVKPGKPSNPQ